MAHANAATTLLALVMQRSRSIAQWGFQNRAKRALWFDRIAVTGDSEAVVDELAIGLSSWIIQDGNYDDFEVGKDYTFALEFFVEEWAPSAPHTKVLTPIRPAIYSFAGDVVREEPELTILDVGILCYSEQAQSPQLRVGCVVGGRMYLGVDPFFWFETHCKRPDLPKLKYRWRVEGIQLETRQEGRQSFVDVKVTDAWKDDNGHGHYVLKCRALGLAP